MSILELIKRHARVIDSEKEWSEAGLRHFSRELLQMIADHAIQKIVGDEVSGYSVERDWESAINDALKELNAA